LAEEVELVRRLGQGRIGDSLDVSPISAVTDAAGVLSLQAAAAAVFVDERVADYAVRLARATRTWPGVAMGAGPRGGLALVRAARAHALLAGRSFVTPDDVKGIGPAALRHRIHLSPEVELEGQKGDSLLAAIFAQVEAPRA
jgi:MoxR-like ATPase